MLGFAGLAAFVHYNDERRAILKGTCFTLWYCQVTAFNKKMGWKLESES
jgi:hypothetical protein